MQTPIENMAHTIMEMYHDVRQLRLDIMLAQIKLSEKDSVIEQLRKELAAPKDLAEIVMRKKPEKGGANG